MATVALVPRTNDRTEPAGNFTDNITAVSSGNTYTFPNDGDTQLLLLNSAGANTLTFITPGTDPDGNAIADKALTLIASKMYFWKRFPSTYTDPATNLVSFTVSANASVAVYQGAK